MSVAAEMTTARTWAVLALGLVGGLLGFPLLVAHLVLAVPVVMLALMVGALALGWYARQSGDQRATDAFDATAWLVLLVLAELVVVPIRDGGGLVLAALMTLVAGEVALLTDRLGRRVLRLSHVTFIDAD
jgi:hypothetical protein